MRKIIGCPTGVLLAKAAEGVSCLAVVMVLFIGASGLRCQAAAPVDDLTGPWQLLVDDYPVLFKTNVVRAYHPFQKYAGNPVMVPDEPWEQPMVYLYGTVLPNETRTGYRMWYHGLRTNNDICAEWSHEYYATSTNGINWVKSPLYLRTACGSSSNNMYYTRPTSGGMTSVIQTPGDPDPARLYKFINFDSGGYYAAWSPDGLHLTDAPNNPVFTAGSDVGQFFWDPHTQLYRGYVKNSWYDWNGLKRRAVALTTSTNITTWSSPSLILWPDPHDDRWIIPGSVQRTHFYGLSAFAYESMYIGLLWIFRATETTGSDPGYLIGPCFVELVSSHDGVNWTREEADRPPILPLGPSGAWDDGMVFTARAPLVEGNTLKLWYGGFDQVHGFALTRTHGAIGLATLRKDGFASLDAGATVGTVVTKLLGGVGGPLQVNYAAVGGSLRVEVLDQNGAVVPGYAAADCAALSGDSTTQTVTWATQSLLPAGVPSLSLRFVLQNASLYSFMAGQSAAVVDVPLITQQPASREIKPAGSASFTVVASALSPLTYQWQKNQTSLSNGGHYSGCATANLTITGADSTDVASYRCMVATAADSVISSAATLSVVSNVFGAVSVVAVPPLAGDTRNEARALTPDGRYVVGLSGTTNGFFYDSLSNRLVKPVSSDGAAAKIVTGVGYRLAQTQLILFGLAGSSPTVWMTTDRGATWAAKVQVSTSGLKNPVIPVANALAGTSSDTFFATWTDQGSGGNDNWGFRVGKAAGSWPTAIVWGQKDVPKPDTTQMNGVSANGRGIGWRRNGTTLAYANYIGDFNGTTAAVFWNSYGLDGTTAGQAYAVSADGTTVFGTSPNAMGGTTNYGYKATFGPSFPGIAPQLSTNRLPQFPDTSGSLTLAVPYGCSADGRYAVGMSYRGAEKAVLWDTSSANPTNWTVIDLTDLAVVPGSSGSFARLARAYSIGTNAAANLVIAGLGFDTNSIPRAFLVTVSPPGKATPIRPTVTVTGSYAAGLTFTFLTVPDSTVMYYLECTTNSPPLSAWTTIAATPGNGGTVSLYDLNPPDPRRFYRVRAQ